MAGHSPDCVELQIPFLEADKQPVGEWQSSGTSQLPNSILCRPLSDPTARTAVSATTGNQVRTNHWSSEATMGDKRRSLSARHWAIARTAYTTAPASSGLMRLPPSHRSVGIRYPEAVSASQHEPDY